MDKTWGIFLGIVVGAAGGLLVVMLLPAIPSPSPVLEYNQLDAHATPWVKEIMDSMWEKKLDEWTMRVYKIQTWNGYQEVEGFAPISYTKKSIEIGLLSTGQFVVDDKGKQSLRILDAGTKDEQELLRIWYISRRREWLRRQLP